MGSQTITFTRHTCDRCGLEADSYTTREDARWGKVGGQTGDGGAIIPGQFRAHACPKCIVSYRLWWNAGGTSPHDDAAQLAMVADAATGADVREGEN